MEENLPALPLVVEEFEWDERNEGHFAERGRLDPFIVENVRDGAPKFYPNKAGMSGSHMMIGRDSDNQVLDGDHPRQRSRSLESNNWLDE